MWVSLRSLRGKTLQKDEMMSSIPLESSKIASTYEKKIRDFAHISIEKKCNCLIPLKIEVDEVVGEFLDDVSLMHLFSSL